MRSFISRLNSSLSVIAEESFNDLLLTESTLSPWKDPNSPNYDRRYAEDCLFHTIGPLTENPKWSPTEWFPRASELPPPEGYKPEGPAPRWTPDEVVIAYAGDPSQLGKEGPRAPGRTGGPKDAPLLRLAMRLSRDAKRGGFQNVSENYQNGLLELSKLLKPGRDASRAPFIGWVTKSIFGAMKHGVGQTLETQRGVTVLKKMSNIKGPRDAYGRLSYKTLLEPAIEKINGYIDIIAPKYQEITSNKYDKDPGNPYGQYSPYVYKLGEALIWAMQEEDPEKEKEVRAELAAALEKAEALGDITLGMTTGAFSAISTPKDFIYPPQRYKKTGESNFDSEEEYQKALRDHKIARRELRSSSIDMPMGDEGNTAAETLVSGGSDDLARFIDQEAVTEIINIALKEDLYDIYGPSPDFQEFLDEVNATPDEVKGTLSPDEFRVLIRNLGSLASQYPGRNKVRSSNVPRYSEGWLKPGEDPELEEIPESGKTWESLWLRKGMPSQSAEDTEKEFKDEASEFKQLNIPTARSAGGASSGSDLDKELLEKFPERTVDMYKLNQQGVGTTEIARRHEITKQNVSARLKKVKDYIASSGLSASGGDPTASAGLSAKDVTKLSNNAMKKIALISKIYADDLGVDNMNEDKINKLNVIREAFDPIDRRFIVENAIRLYNFLEYKLMNEYGNKYCKVESESSLRDLYMASKMKSYKK